MVTVVIERSISEDVEDVPRQLSSPDDVTPTYAVSNGTKNDVIASSPLQLNCTPLSGELSLEAMSASNRSHDVNDDDDDGGVGAGAWLRAMVRKTAPGAFLLEKLDRYKEQRRELKRRRITEKELRRLNRKIEKLLTRLDDADAHCGVSAASVEECVICLSAPATMQTFPCAHRVACRRCFVRTIQTAIVERSLPLRCVVCRSRILKLNDPMDKSSVASATNDRMSTRGISNATVNDRKMTSSSAALPGINPLLVRSTVTQRVDKMATSVRASREAKYNGGSKVIERRMMAPLPRCL